MTLTEDSRAAANIAVTLSSQLAAAALTMLTILGAFVVFVLDKREPTGGFVGTAVATFALFVAVVLVGGRGVANLYRAVAGGAWMPDASRSTFNLQAGLALGALLGFAATIAVSFGLPTRPEPVAQAAASPRWVDSVRVAREEMRELRRVVDSLRSRSAAPWPECCCGRAAQNAADTPPRRPATRRRSCTAPGGPRVGAPGPEG